MYESEYDRWAGRSQSQLKVGNLVNLAD
jgi:hypothetical protein